MRVWFTILIILSFSCAVIAEEQYVRKFSGYPHGTFKKSRSGKIIQYDNHGKKVGVYNINTRKRAKIK